MNSNDNQKSPDYFDKLEDKFDAYIDDYDVQRRKYLIFSILLENIDTKGKKVLEVGCGTGRFSKPLKEQGAELTVLDIGENLVRSVSENLRCEGVVGDACKLPFEDKTFDIIISSECIEHTLDPDEAIKEICRLCRRGGCVCLTTPNKLWYPVLVLSERLGLRKFSGIENWIFPSKAQRIMRANGIKDIKLRGCHLWPFQLKYTRPILTFFDTYCSWMYSVMINFGIVGQKG